MKSKYLSVLFFSFFLFACSNDERAEAAFELAPLEWEDCSGDSPARCTLAELPIHYDNLGGEKISVAVRHVPALTESRAQLWMLAGGPGESGIEAFSLNMDLIRTYFRSLDHVDLYTLDHRGVGGSEPLSCPNQTANADCLGYLEQTYGERLQGLSTTASARDVGELIKATRQEGQQVFVLGVSYGTYLTQRYAQLFPDQADGIILDGVSPAGNDVSQANHGYNSVAELFFSACAGDETCRSKLGDDPWQFLTGLNEKLDGGHCPEINLESATFKEGIAGALRSAYLRPLIAPAVYRINRCNADDVTAINNHFLPLTVSPPVSADQDVASPLLLNFHVILSEMWNYDTPPTVAALNDEFNTINVGNPAVMNLAAAFESWPRYDRDAYDDELMDYSGPLLMLQGGLDPATPHSEASHFADIYNGPNQTYAFFPDSAHGIIASALDNIGNSCGQQLVIAFIVDPTAPLDLSCIDNVLPVSFTPDGFLSFTFFGTFDPWGDS